MNGDDTTELLQAIYNELSSIKLWIPSSGEDYHSELGAIEDQLARTNELLEAILEALRK